MLDLAAHQLHILAKHADAEAVGRYLTEQHVGSEEAELRADLLAELRADLLAELRADLLAELRAGLTWLTDVVAAAEQEQGIGVR